ncbi:amidohydrolase [Pseudoroseomonas deserti]|uniref:Amidohydrolase n=1 Tax=Teichococcus deserti TaxID=1817963 RepID=A0A1V2H0U3_9PROT|nr:amidohydrolase [Pseudoroseomonas deserti]ONG51777.1 amidohydrolase [Pseudoroseomonas deserti]
MNDAAFWQKLVEWRRDFHRHPEFGFEEGRTARLVAERLRGFGLEVAEGVGGTGVVGTLRRGDGGRSIALRADMDALRIAEQGESAWRSTTPGMMHGCGHDGHVTMLLGAAEKLATEGGFAGTVNVLFQPAEEWGRGAQAMIDAGLLDRFPFDEVYGLHNMPGMAVGHFTTRAGPVMAAEDIFDIRLTGKGGHASQPQAGREVMLAACALVVALQAIVSRRLPPGAAAVVSVTELTTDGTRNVLPGQARIQGDARSFLPGISATIEEDMRRIAEGVALAHGCTAEVTYTREFIPTLNHPGATAAALAAARAALGDSHVDDMAEPITASEDFARFLALRPGCFAFLGNGAGSAPLHNPRYDFCDDAIPHGVGFFTAIARQRLAPGAEPLA